MRKELPTMEPKTSETSPQDDPVPRWSVSSSSGLRYGTLVNSVSSLAPIAAEKPAISTTRAYIAIAVLCYVNLLNYMERYTIAGQMILLCCMSTHAVIASDLVTLTGNFMFIVMQVSSPTSRVFLK